MRSFSEQNKSTMISREGPNVKNIRGRNRCERSLTVSYNLSTRRACVHRNGSVRASKRQRCSDKLAVGTDYNQHPITDHRIEFTDKKFWAESATLLRYPLLVVKHEILIRKLCACESCACGRAVRERHESIVPFHDVRCVTSFSIIPHAVHLLSLGSPLAFRIIFRRFPF